MMARKSVTFVKVGPGVNRSPIPLKKPVESLSARNAAGSRPAARARAGGGRVDEGAGRVVRTAAPAIGPVAVRGERGNAGSAGKMHGKRQRVFLVRAAAAAPAQGHGQFTAGKDGGAPALRAQFEGEARMLGGDLARFALQAVAERRWHS